MNGKMWARKRAIRILEDMAAPMQQISATVFEALGDFALSAIEDVIEDVTTRLRNPKVKLIDLTDPTSNGWDPFGVDGSYSAPNGSHSDGWAKLDVVDDQPNRVGADFATGYVPRHGRPDVAYGDVPAS